MKIFMCFNLANLLTKNQIKYDKKCDAQYDGKYVCIYTNLLAENEYGWEKYENHFFIEYVLHKYWNRHFLLPFFLPDSIEW